MEHLLHVQSSNTYEQKSQCFSLQDQDLQYLFLDSFNIPHVPPISTHLFILPFFCICLYPELVHKQLEENVCLLFIFQTLTTSRPVQT